mmetsp:Transcript_26109/g.64692  ORF Transcript_26109/g.64692 Transcript_26109/m.64692 type:complete len:94 (-) Transcript_26109:358-639(-)
MANTCEQNPSGRVYTLYAPLGNEKKVKLRFEVRDSTDAPNPLRADTAFQPLAVVSLNEFKEVNAEQVPTRKPNTTFKNTWLNPTTIYTPPLLT